VEPQSPEAGPVAGLLIDRDHVVPRAERDVVESDVLDRVQ